MTKLNWCKGANAQIDSEDKQIELYWKDPHMSFAQGLVIITKDEWNNAVGLSVEEATKLRDYLNSVIPRK